MIDRQPPDHSQTEDVKRRQKERDELLEEALRRPGIREVMKVYEDWKRADRALESHRAIERWKGEITTRSNTSATER